MGAQQGGISAQQMQQYMAQAGMPQSVQQDDGSQAGAQDANAVASSTTGNVASQDAKVARGDAANAVDAQQTANVDQSGTSSDDSTGASGSANAAPNNSDNESTAGNASADQGGNTASTPDATTNSDKGLLSAIGNNKSSSDAAQPVEPSAGAKLLSILRNPLISNSLMNAGFGMMAASRPGTPWFSAIGQGAQEGMQTYQAMKQQQIQNLMAQQKFGLEMQRANDEHASSQAATAQTQATTAGLAQKLSYNTSLRNYIGSTPSNQITPQGIIANGGSTSDVEAMFPGVDVSPPDDAGVSRIVDKRTGQVLSTIQGTKLTSVAPGSSVYNFGGQGGAGPGGAVGAGGSSVAPVTPQPLVQGGLPPADIAKSVAGYNTTQKQYSEQAQTQDQFLNQLQTKQALTGTGKGGVIPQAFRQIENVAGVYDNNSNLRQQYQNLSVQKEMSLLPAGSRMDQTYLKMVQKTMADPSNATPEQMMQTAAFARSAAQRQSIDSEVRAAFVGANGGMETPLAKPTSITVQGQTMNLPKGTTIQQAADAATSKLVDWDPPLINPKWADSAKVNDQQIQQALQLAQDPVQRKKLRAAGILLPSNMRNGGQ
jgi:hypothetical protein